MHTKPNIFFFPAGTFSRAVIFFVLLTGHPLTGLFAQKSPYADGRPSASRRLTCHDEGIVLRYGEGPDSCDTYGAREAIVNREGDDYYLFYDGAGPHSLLSLSDHEGPVPWDAAHKDVVLDSTNCSWAKGAIGMPSVIAVKGKLALLYDAAGGRSTSHMHRDIGLAWLTLPIKVPR